MIDLYTELREVTRALTEAGVSYALCGGLALMLYQRPRATAEGLIALKRLRGSPQDLLDIAGLESLDDRSSSKDGADPHV